MSKARGIALRVVFVTVATIVLLEVVLQAMAMAAAWTMSGDEADVRKGDRVVLCIGDSYTYGLGSTDKKKFSYPSQLEELLRERVGPDWKVVNHGWPGRNSRELLERIRGQLEKYEPSLVYIVVGVNDFWMRPERLDLPDEPRPEAPRSTFRWEWRTGRLLAWLTGSTKSGEEVRRGTAGMGATALAGTVWILNGVLLAFPETGGMNFGGLDIPCKIERDRITIEEPGGKGTTVSWSLSGETLRLELPGLPAPLQLTRIRLPEQLPEGEAAQSKQKPKSGWDWLDEGRPALAEKALRAQILREPHSAPWARVPLIYALQQQDKSSEIAEQLAWFAAQHEKTGGKDETLTRNYVHALDAAGRIDAVKQMLPACLEQFPENDYLWERVAWYAFQERDLTRARSAITKSLSLTKQDNAYRLRIAASIDRDDDPRSALRYVIRAFRVSKDRASFIQDLQTNASKSTESMLDEVLDELAADAAERKELAALRKAALDEEAASVKATYRAHLRQLVEECRRSGATPVIASYPFHDGRLAALQKAVAQEFGLAYLDIATELDRRRDGKPRSHFFVSDGHCSDAGYRVMATVIAEDAVPRLE